MKEQVKWLECAEQAWIDQYLLGDLDREENSRFELKMKSDPRFREKVELHKDLIAGVFLFETKDSPAEAEPGSVGVLLPKHVFDRLLKLCAVIALLIAGFLLINKTSTVTEEVTAELSRPGIEYPTEWAFGDVDFGEMAVLNNIPLYMDRENVMLYWHFFEFHNALPN